MWLHSIQIEEYECKSDLSWKMNTSLFKCQYSLLVRPPLQGEPKFNFKVEKNYYSCASGYFFLTRVDHVKLRLENKPKSIFAPFCAQLNEKHTAVNLQFNNIEQNDVKIYTPCSRLPVVRSACVWCQNEEHVRLVITETAGRNHHLSPQERFPPLRPA